VCGLRTARQSLHRRPARFPARWHRMRAEMPLCLMRFSYERPTRDRAEAQVNRQVARSLDPRKIACPRIVAEPVTEIVEQGIGAAAAHGAARAVAPRRSRVRLARGHRACMNEARPCGPHWSARRFYPRGCAYKTSPPPALVAQRATSNGRRPGRARAHLASIPRARCACKV
jgi:hypothetical protein